MSPRIRVDRTTVFVALGVVLLIAMYAWAVSLAQRYYVTSAPESSTFSSSPAGLKVLFAYLDGLGMKPQTLQQFDDLPAKATIVAVGPFQKQPTRGETDALARWVRAGGRLVVAGMDSELLTQPLKLGGAPSSGAASETLRPLLPTAYARGVREIAPGPDRLLTDSPSWATHYKDFSGQVLVSQKVGSGEVLWLAGAYPLSNAGIGTADNARLATLLAAAGERAIYFDEYHHNYVRTTGAWQLLGSSGRAGVLLLAAALAILLLAWGRRLGPAIEERVEPAARGGAYIGSLAELYRKAGAGAEALETLEDGLRRALVRGHGSVETGLARHTSAAEALAASAQARASGRVSEDTLLEVARRIRRARQEVEGRDG